MGKKGSWFSAIKKVFSPNSQEKQVNGEERKSSRDKKKGRGILIRHGETKSFIPPAFRGPSSIEKILGEVDQQKLHVRPPTPSEQPKTPPLVPPRVDSPRVTSPRVASPRVASPRIASPRVASARVVASPRPTSPRVDHQRREIKYRPEPTLRNQHLSATRIQAAYRGYRARRSFRALRGLVRLQGVVKSHNVKRQTTNAMKHMQLLVRVQTQIQSRRIHMLESQAVQRQAHQNDREVESSLGKWTPSQFDARESEDWDDSQLTKEEIEARMQRKVEAIMKRERAMAYAYSHKLWKANPKSAQTTLMGIRNGGFPWWWNWLERQLPLSNAAESQATKNAHPTPPRPNLEPKHSPRPPSVQNQNFSFDNVDTLTPRSTRSTVPVRTRQLYTPPSRTPPQNGSSGLLRYSKPRNSNSGFDVGMRDDDSLTSCPPFSVPSYMAPTASAKAKARAYSNPRERFPGTPSGESSSKRRFSFPLTPNIGPFKWNNKGSSNKDDSTSQQRTSENRKSLHAAEIMSVDSTTSMPAAVGRRPFNRFV